MQKPIGLLRGKSKLLPHQDNWEENASEVISKLKCLLGHAAVDIQHVGSTAIASIQAKPIIDIAVAVQDLNKITAYMELLEQNSILFRGEDVPGQMLFVMGN